MEQIIEKGKHVPAAGLRFCSRVLMRLVLDTTTSQGVRSTDNRIRAVQGTSVLAVQDKDCTDRPRQWEETAAIDLSNETPFIEFPQQISLSKGSTETDDQQISIKLQRKPICPMVTESQRCVEPLRLSFQEGNYHCLS